MEMNNTANVKTQIITTASRMGMGVKAVANLGFVPKEVDTFFGKTKKNVLSVTGVDHCTEETSATSMGYIFHALSEQLEQATAKDIILLLPEQAAIRVFEAQKAVKAVPEVSGEDLASLLIKPWMLDEELGDPSLVEGIKEFAEAFLKTDANIRITMTHNLSAWRITRGDQEVAKALDLEGMSLDFNEGKAIVGTDEGEVTISLENNRVSGYLEIKKDARGRYYVDRHGNKTVEFDTMQKMSNAISAVLPTSVVEEESAVA